ncbi:MAG TPA: hypothetical protein VF008_28310, partial [Niastella sp.]
MNFKCLLIALAWCPTFLFAQKYNIKKGKITVDNSLIATYDGKGGILAFFNLTISSPGKKPLINVKERYFDLLNPLRRNDTRWAEITFFDNTEKKTGYLFPYNNRYLEKDLLGLLFNNDKPCLVQGEALNEQAVNDFIKAHKYDFVTDSLYIRQFEKENKERILPQLSRDKKAPVTLEYDYKHTDESETIIVHNVLQDGVLLGKVEKIFTGGDVYYIFWKRVLTPYSFEGETMDAAMLAFMKPADGNFDSDLVLMVDKSKHKLKITDRSNAE